MTLRGAAIVVGATWLSGVLAAVVVALGLAAAGAEDVTPLAALNLAALTAAGAFAAVALVADRRAVGLVRPAPRLFALAVAVGLTVVAAAAAVGVGNPPVPAELSEQGQLDRVFGDPDPTVVDLGLDALLSLAARGVIAPVTAALLLAGVVFPAVQRRFGEGAGFGAVMLTAALIAGLPGLVLGALVCFLFRETRSALPGAVVVCAYAGYHAGVSFQWASLDAVAAGAGCALAALALLDPLGISRGAP